MWYTNTWDYYCSSVTGDGRYVFCTNMGNKTFSLYIAKNPSIYRDPSGSTTVSMRFYYVQFMIFIISALTDYTPWGE